MLYKFTFIHLCKATDKWGILPMVYFVLVMLRVGLSEQFGTTKGLLGFRKCSVHLCASSIIYRLYTSSWTVVYLISVKILKYSCQIQGQFPNNFCLECTLIFDYLLVLITDTCIVLAFKKYWVEYEEYQNINHIGWQHSFSK